MRPDNDIERDVRAELRFRPDIDERDIAVKVNNAVVMLSGYARSFLDKQRAEQAVKRIAGVAGVANDIEVRLGRGVELTDPEIARAAVQTIRSEAPTVGENVRVLVHHGYLTLEGKVEWFYLKELVERAVHGLQGVTGVTNAINIVPRSEPAEIRQRIEDAFRRSAQIDADHISIEASDGEVTLRGRVRSWAERDEAHQTAWSAPGVRRVNNEITIGTD